MGMFERILRDKIAARMADDDRHEYGSPRPQDIVNGSPAAPSAPSGDGIGDRLIDFSDDRDLEAAEKVLDTLEAELDNEADADILADGMRPNEAMRWLIRLRELRANPLARSY